MHICDMRRHAAREQPVSRRRNEDNQSPRGGRITPPNGGAAAPRPPGSCAPPSLLRGLGPPAFCLPVKGVWLFFPDGKFLKSSASEARRGVWGPWPPGSGRGGQVVRRAKRPVGLCTACPRRSGTGNPHATHRVRKEELEGAPVLDRRDNFVFTKDNFGHWLDKNDLFFVFRSATMWSLKVKKGANFVYQSPKIGVFSDFQSAG